ncbi:FAD/NAD(P)-binding domain-containing protein [Thozetella sp. PMI_491]|nr:FAD/NAD(P)-binding domain-containing protein [Thozetella sp. PMI_491]
MEGEARIRLAIVGGGLAGATIANALVQIPHLEIHIYESAPEFSERGAALGLSTDTQRALGRAIPSAPQLLERAGAVPLNSTRAVIGSGPKAGTLVIDFGESPSEGERDQVLHRASFLRELLAPLPKESLHAGKKLIGIKETQNGVEVTSVRGYVLQESAEKYAATPAGFWDSRVLVPFDKAVKTLGKEHFQLDRQYSWVGDKAFIMHDVLEDRTMVQCVISTVETDFPKDRKRALTRELLTDVLQNWLDGPIGKGAIELTLDQPDPQGYSQWEHKATPTYANGRVCIVGDAAHATTPWQGFGVGMAIEDAMVLAVLFRAIRSADEIEAVFRAYDSVRLPRCQQVIDSSRRMGQIACGQPIDVNPDELRAALGSQSKAIDDLDLVAHEQDALNMLNEF